MGELAETLREERASAELSLDDVGGKAGLSSGYLSQVESGQHIPRRTKIKPLAKALGVDAEQLLAERDRDELVERWGFDPAAAEIAVQLNRQDAAADDLRSALEQLDPDSRAMLFDALKALEASHVGDRD